jgi:hypothetical protein
VSVIFRMVYLSLFIPSICNEVQVLVVDHYKFSSNVLIMSRIRGASGL